MIYGPKKYRENMHKHIDRIASGEIAKGSVPIGIKKIDDLLVPIAPTDLGVVLAQPGNGKSAFMLSMTFNAGALYNASKDEYSPPIYITRETAIEELSLRMLANYAGISIKEIKDSSPYIDWTKVHDDLDSMIDEFPVIFVGHSMYSDDDRRILSPSMAIDAVKSIHDNTGKPSVLVSVDYLQRFNHETIRDRREAMTRIVDDFKDMALQEHVPVLLGSQAKREVSERTFPIPLQTDGVETSNIEHTSDWMVSLMRPAKHWQVGSVIPKSSNNTIVTHDLFFINILKQRSGETNVGEYCSFDMRIFQLSDLEL